MAGVSMAHLMDGHKLCQSLQRCLQAQVNEHEGWGQEWCPLPGFC